jgi:hypothetical protein
MAVTTRTLKSGATEIIADGWRIVVSDGGDRCKVHGPGGQARLHAFQPTSDTQNVVLLREDRP